MRTNYFASFKTLLPFFLILLVTASCQKKSENTVDPCPKTVAGIAGVYKLASLTYKASSTSAEQDYLILMDGCEQDDIISFEANGTFNYQDAGMVCSPDGTYSGTWGIAGNKIISDGVVNGTIQSFDCRKLIAYSTGVIVPGDRITLTIEKQ